ncbi:MAG: type II toxin-antitoxin system HipA family toxin [Alcaligenaceae bacterium]|nr:type II toxin-antitoxin system HipA family toxin [Alcaligenaceae bacterium]
MTPLKRLDVFYNRERVGFLYDTEPLGFEYDPQWLASEKAFPLGLVPLEGGVLQGSLPESFFENLLPEGDLRIYLSQQRKASTLFSLLYEVAGDTAGAFTLLPEGQVPGSFNYKKTSWQELANLFTQSVTPVIDIQDNQARISLAGAQHKLSVLLRDNNVYLPEGIAPSSHIIKPDILRFDGIWDSALNETIIMRTANYWGLPVPHVFYEPATRSCVVKRFDRFENKDGSLGRLVQYDLCQLSGELSNKKYEKEGGPSVKDCVLLIKKHSSQPAIDLKNFVRWLIFNLYVGNNDSHAKNLSMYRLSNGHFVLTPFYDLMSTRVYSGLSPEFAFSIGGEYKPGSIGRDNIVGLANDIGMRPRFVLDIATELVHAVPLALEQALASLVGEVPADRKVMPERLQQFVLSNIRKISSRIL